CPAILHRMVAEGALSVGLQATCRNLHFDRQGRLVQRLADRGRGPDGGARAAPAPPGAERLVEAGGQGALLVGGDDGRRQLVDLAAAAEQARDCGALCGSGTQVAERLAEVGKLAVRYQDSAPPVPCDVALAEGLAEQAPGASAPAAPQRRKRRRRRRFVIESEASSGEEDSGDSLLERLGHEVQLAPGPRGSPPGPPGAPEAEEGQCQRPEQPGLLRPPRVAGKRTRHAEKIGLRRGLEHGNTVVLLARPAARADAAPPAPRG
ncbi:unnamed protein product, partial [Prorocentrum cordatum]